MPAGIDPGTAVREQPDSQGPADITQTGGQSPYGTMAQGGNVWEREETESDLVNDNPESGRSVRGGGWHDINPGTSSANNPGYSYYTEVGRVEVGFRVAAAVPEPSTELLSAMSFLVLRLAFPFKKNPRTVATASEPTDFDRV